MSSRVAWLGIFGCASFVLLASACTQDFDSLFGGLPASGGGTTATGSPTGTGGTSTGSTSSGGQGGDTSTGGSTSTGGNTSTTTSTTGSGAGGSAAGGSGAGGEPPPLCHPQELYDEFSGNAVDDTLWGLQGKQSIISVYGGMLHLAPDADAADQWAGVVTKSKYDVSDCSVWIEVPSLIDQGSQGGTYWQLYSGGTRAGVRAGDGQQLKLFIADASPEEVQVPYDPVAHRWWRIREDSGTLFVETAPDGINWSVQHSAATPALIDDAAVGLGVTPANGLSNPGETQLDNFNIEP